MSQLSKDIKTNFLSQIFRELFHFKPRSLLLGHPVNYLVKNTLATSFDLKARSHNPILRIRFLVRKLEAGVQTVRFQGSVFVVRMSEGHL